MKRLVLDTLKKGLPNLTAALGAYLVEAALFCLEYQAHKSGIQLEVYGTIKRYYSVLWKGDLTQQMRYSYGDLGEAAEYGATCLAILMAIENTGYNSVERSCKGTGIDFWLGHGKGDKNELTFQRAARLEVSGIMNGGKGRVNERAKEKISQTDKSNDTRLPAYIIVVEFSTPISKYIEK